jgi:hypothetical protein
MYARFLYAWPNRPAYRELPKDIFEEDVDLINALGRLVDLSDEEDGQRLKSFVPFRTDALDEFERFRALAHVRHADLEDRERDYHAKSEAQILRISGVLAYLEHAFTGNPEPNHIDLKTIKNAIRVWDEFFLPHAKAGLRLIGLSDRYRDARRALRWLQRAGKSEVSREDIRREAMSQRLDAEQTGRLLEVLAKGGWVRRDTTHDVPGKRGPKHQRWQVNPALLTKG